MTFILNSWAVAVVRKKEKNGRNRKLGNCDKIMLFPGRNEPVDNLGLYCEDLCICPGIAHLRHQILNPRRRQSWTGALCTQSLLRHHPLWLQPTCSCWNCSLPLHHGLPRRDGRQLWRWEEGVENYPEGDPLALPPAQRPCCPRPSGQPRFPQVCWSRGELQVVVIGTLWTIFFFSQVQPQELLPGRRPNWHLSLVAPSSVSFSTRDGGTLGGLSIFSRIMWYCTFVRDTALPEPLQI